MKTYGELKNAIVASQGRQTKIREGLAATITKFREQIKAAEAAAAEDIGKERVKEQALLEQLQNQIKADLGTDVRIGTVKPSGPTLVATRTPSSSYKRVEIVARIVELRRTGVAFETIANKLNEEGFKPLSAPTFSGPTVYQIYKSSIKTPQTATA